MTFYSNYHVNIFKPKKNENLHVKMPINATDTMYVPQSHLHVRKRFCHSLKSALQPFFISTHYLSSGHTNRIVS